MPDSQLEIQTLIGRYAHAVDERDVNRIVACFTADAEFHHDGGAPVQGTDELRAFFAEALTHPRMGNAGTSTHMMSNVVIELEGDRGLVQTSAIACLASQSRNSVVLRGLRYNDECVRIRGVAYREATASLPVGVRSARRRC